MNGDLTVSQAGAVVDGKDVHGCVNVKAPHVTVRRSKITCTGFFGVASLAEWYKGGGLTVEDTEISCGNTNGTGIGSYGVVARRVNIHNCENGFDVDTSVTVTGKNFAPAREAWTGKAREGIGTFIEVLRPSVERHETLFSSLGRPEGVAAIADGMSGEVQEHAYWGGMRDRIPLSQTDAMAPAGNPELIRDGAPQRAATDQQHARRRKPPLTGFTDLRKERLAVISL